MPANKYGDKPDNGLDILFLKNLQPIILIFQMPGELKLKFRCCLYLGFEYFASSPFNPPKQGLFVKKIAG